MEDKLHKHKTKNLIKLLQSREINVDAGKTLFKRSQFTSSLIKRLGLEYELEGHQGCVNCLEWTPDGRFLASGSDDTNVILWDPFRHKQLQIIPTRHIGNIFSVKFLGGNSNIVASAAADCRVLVQTTAGAAQQNTPILECGCHINRVKRLAVSPEETTLFWSAAEDGLVLQYDLREQHDCNTMSKVLIDLSRGSEVKCISVHPTKPHYIAIGANDCYIRLYDRRKLKPFAIQEIGPRNGQIQGSPRPSPQDPIDPNCVQFFAPGHLAKDNAYTNNLKLAVTYVSFNSTGSEMLVNIGGEQIYLFDVNNPRHINELKIPQYSTKNIKTEAYKCCCHSDPNNGINSSKIDLGLGKTNCACFYMRRAFQCYHRKWIGDVYSAARDYLHVIQNWPKHRPAYVGLIDCFISLKWADAAKRWFDHYTTMFPDYGHAKTMRDSIQELESDPKEIIYEKEFVKKTEEHEANLRLDSRDYEVRFVGHCNTTTDIKEVNFLGEDGNFICAGSDEGIIFIWDRKTSSIVTALMGDASIVNCIQPHPSACFIASSGIDPNVKLWSPICEDEKANQHVVKDIKTVVEANQHRMAMDPFESMLVNIGLRAGGTHSFTEVPCRTC